MKYFENTDVRLTATVLLFLPALRRVVDRV